MPGTTRKSTQGKRLRGADRPATVPSDARSDTGFDFADDADRVQTFTTDGLYGTPTLTLTRADDGPIP